MVFEHLDESLSYDTGGAEDTDRNFAVHMSSWNSITVGESRLLRPSHSLEGRNDNT